MLSDIKPDLENITHRHMIFPDNSAKNALAVPWNAHEEIRFFFLGLPRKAQVLQNFRVQALQIKIWFHLVHKPDAERLGRFEQEADENIFAVNSGHPKVQKALKALRKLRDFLDVELACSGADAERGAAGDSRVCAVPCRDQRDFEAAGIDAPSGQAASNLTEKRIQHARDAATHDHDVGF